jgi:glutamate-1-semialdehyde 2,1-aminomutase
MKKQKSLTKTKQLFAEAQRHIPFGVNSNFRYWEEDTFVVTHGKDAHVWDADGNRYIDYRLGFGPIILGHAYPGVTEKVAEVLQHGNIFAWTTPYEIELAERFTRMTGMDMVRLSNTGTEATMHALRVARAYTQRELFIKFDGQYHGNYDYVMYNTPGVDAERLGKQWPTRKLPASSGIPKSIDRYLISLPYNNFEAIEETMARYGEQVAAIMVEPVMGNTAGIVPRTGWLEKLRELCDRYGTLLVFDEVKTGFRIANGGAQEYFGVKADLAAYAKAMGNGFPIAAIAGREEVMMTIEPGKVAQGGTYVGNVISVAAANATLQIIEEQPIIETIFARGRSLMEGMDEILTRHDIPHAVTGIPSMFSLIVGTNEAPVDFTTYARNNDDFYEALALKLVDLGVMPDSDSREPWFMCYTHSEQDIAETLEIFDKAVTDVKHGFRKAFAKAA